MEEKTERTYGGQHVELFCPGDGRAHLLVAIMGDLTLYWFSATS